MEKSVKERQSLRREIFHSAVNNNISSKITKSPVTRSPPIESDHYKKYMNNILNLWKKGEWDLNDLINVKKWKRWVVMFAKDFNDQWKFTRDASVVEFAETLMAMFFDENYPYLHRAQANLDNNQTSLLFQVKQLYKQAECEKIEAKARLICSTRTSSDADESLDIYTFDVNTDAAPLVPFNSYPDSPKCIKDRSVSPKRIFGNLQQFSRNQSEGTHQEKTNHPYGALSRNKNKRSNVSSWQTALDNQHKRHRSGDQNCSARHGLDIKIIRLSSPQHSSRSNNKEARSSIEKKTLSDQEILTVIESDCIEDDSNNDIFEKSCSYPNDEDVVYENPTPPCSPACTTTVVDVENASHANRSEVSFTNRENTKPKTVSGISPGQKKDIKCASSGTNAKFRPSDLKNSETRKKGISIKKIPSSKEPLTQSGGNKTLEESFELPDIDQEPHIDPSNRTIEQDKENYPISVDEIAVKYPKPLTAPTLTLEMFETLKNILDRPPKEKVVTGFSLYILQEDLAVYNKDTEWLNDRNIDFYLELIRERSLRTDFPRVYIFHSFFYTLLTDKDGGYEIVQETTGEEDLFKYDIVFFPVHLNHHWRLVVVKFSEKSLKCYDSMNHDNSDVLKHIGKYLKKEYRRKHRNNNRDNSTAYNSASEDERNSPVPIPISSAGEPLKTGWFFDSNLWTVENVSSEIIPQQKNAIDCGIFLLQYAEYLSREKEFDFDQSHIPYFRKRIMYETLTKQLLTSVRNENVGKPEENE